MGKFFCVNCGKVHDATTDRGRTIRELYGMCLACYDKALAESFKRDLSSIDVADIRYRKAGILSAIAYIQKKKNAKMGWWLYAALIFELIILFALIIIW